MSTNWQSGAALEPFDFEALLNDFGQDRLSLTNASTDDSNDSHNHPYFDPDEPTMQYGAYHSTAFDEFDRAGWSSFGAVGSSQMPILDSPILSVAPEALHQAIGLGNSQNAWNTNEHQTAGVYGVGASLSGLTDFTDVAADYLHPPANITSQQPPQDFAPQVREAGASQPSTDFAANFEFNVLVNVEGAGHPSLGGIQQLDVEKNLQSQNTHSTSTRSQNDSSGSGSGLRPRKPRANKAAVVQPASSSNQQATPDEATEITIVPVLEPDANYAFTVTDMSDVYLDPKPQLPFGRHEPHLVPKVTAAVRAIRASKKAHEDGGAPKTTMANLHAAIQSRNSALASQPGPRPQKPRAAPTVQWKSPENDPSIPTTAFAYGTCLHLLTNAICNRVGCFESENAEFRNRYFVGSTYFPESAVASLAERILDAVIDVHENGFPHQTLDPDYDERYRKTQGFNFRDRLNLVTRILKHSKNTCNELFKNFRLYDVIGGAYDLETRIYSNYVNNKKKSEKEKNRKAEESSKKIAEQKGIHGTTEANKQKAMKRSLESGHNSRPNKRAKLNASKDKSHDQIEQTSLSAAIASSAGPTSVTEAPRKGKNAAVNPSTTSAKAPGNRVTSSGGKKRAAADTEEDEEPSAPPAKKSKTDSRPKAVKKPRAKAKPAPPGPSIDDDDGDDFDSAYEEKAPARRKGTKKSGTGLRTECAPARGNKSTTGRSSAPTESAPPE